MTEMPRQKRLLEGTVTLDGQSLCWSLHSEQLWCTADGWRGLCLRVRVSEATRRELFLQYPAVTTKKQGYALAGQARPKVTPAKVEAHIRQAMDAGWNPESRGKPFLFQVEEQPS